MFVRRRWLRYLPGPKTMAFLLFPRLAASMRSARSAFSIPASLRR